MLVRSFTRRQMRAGLQLVQDLANRVHLNYEEDAQIHDGRGQPITHQDVLILAHRREEAGQLATER
jgi:hypothetical protein